MRVISRSVGRLSNETLMTLAAMHGHEILFAPLTDNKAFSVEHQVYHIVLSNKLTRTEERKWLPMSLAIASTAVLQPLFSL